MDFPGNSVAKNLPAMQEPWETQVWSIPGLGRSPGRGHGNPPQYSSLENLLSRLVITILPRSKCLLISRLQSPSAVILELKKIVCHCFHCFPTYIGHDVMGLDAMIFVFWMFSFKPAFSLSSFTFIKRLFSSSSLSAIKVLSSVFWGYWYFCQKSCFQFVLHPGGISHNVLCM